MFLDGICNSDEAGDRVVNRHDHHRLPVATHRDDSRLSFRERARFVEDQRGDRAHHLERDVIFLSVTYGKSPDGRLRYNFGLINGENG